MVGINCVEYDNIVVAPVGGDWKTPCLVCVKLTLDVNHGHETMFVLSFRGSCGGSAMGFGSEVVGGNLVDLMPCLR